MFIDLSQISTIIAKPLQINYNFIFLEGKWPDFEFRIQMVNFASLIRRGSPDTAQPVWMQTCRFATLSALRK
ncbi:MAG: hypothetical protein EBU80_02215 [Chitinophagia bacterium]|nr:hypothetical protein [Chitinophagia bacterium]